MKKLLMIILISACASSEEEKMYDQSVETHDLAIKIGLHVNEKIKQIEMHLQTLDEPMKSLLKDSLEILVEDFAFWKSTIVEIPGNEHDEHYDDHIEHDEHDDDHNDHDEHDDDHNDHDEHDDDHTGHDHAGHDHNHVQAADLTPKMMLDIQKDLRGRILKLNIRAQKILKTLEEK
ncbi:MAG: hypothetical protein AAF600_08000 [Bacteroidota bacterium]